MKKLARSDLLSLEAYAEQREDFRARVLAHKRNRTVGVGEHLTLLFEDRYTMQYQIQEMLRAERIFEPEAIEEELAAYNPLTPDGSNLKATLLIEYEDLEERKRALATLLGIEDKVWVRVDGFDPVWAIADEDMERDNSTKTSAVHFLRFEFSPEMIAAAKQGAPLSVGVDHPRYTGLVDPLPENVRAALVADFV
jgi:hypothetical protein